MTLRIETSTDRWARMIRSTGIVGLITIAVLFAPIIAISSLGEPPFVASAEAARTFFVNGSAGWAQLAEALTSLSAIGLIWFAGGLSLLLARGEGSPPWRSAVALVSGVMLSAYPAFWIWMIIICVQLVWRPGTVLNGADGHARQRHELP